MNNYIYVLSYLYYLLLDLFEWIFYIFVIIILSQFKIHSYVFIIRYFI